LRAALATAGATVSVPASLAPLAAATAVDISHERRAEATSHESPPRILITDHGSANEHGIQRFVQWLGTRAIELNADDQKYSTSPERGVDRHTIVFVLGEPPRASWPANGSPTTWVYFGTLAPWPRLDAPGLVIDGDSLLPRMRDEAGQGTNLDGSIRHPPPQLPEGEAFLGSRYGIVAEYVIAATVANEPL
jgi:hypothetical protein